MKRIYYLFLVTAIVAPFKWLFLDFRERIALEMSEKDVFSTEENGSNTFRCLLTIKNTSAESFLGGKSYVA